MVKPLYRVYIDEAGDRGWGGRSSETFVVSAVIVKDADDKAVRQSVDQLSSQLGKSPGTVLHWAENVRTHTSRKHCAREIAKLPVTLANVVIVKNSLMGQGSALSDASHQYNYAIRRLLERITWYVDDQGGEAVLTFAHVRRFPYSKMKAYFALLQAQGSQIRWNSIRSYKIDQPNRVRLLQLADLVAGCVYAAVRADEFGDHEPAYLLTIAPLVYVRGKAKVTSYGFNIIGTPNCMNVYPWWKQFKAVCEP
jgi:hypothetical protein